MKKVLAFDIDQTLNIAKTPIDDDMAKLLIECLRHFEICPISGQKFEQFLIQIVNRLRDNGATVMELTHLHLFVAQGTQYYRYEVGKKFGPVEVSVIKPSTPYDEQSWRQIYNYPLTDEQVARITSALESAAKELGFWYADQLDEGVEVIENRLSQVTYSALGQKATTSEKYDWDPDCAKRKKIVTLAKEKAPEFDYEIGGTTSINAFTPGMNKKFGMTHLLDELNVDQSDVLYFGDMTQPGGNDYPIVQMGIDTITVRSHEDTAYALRGILGVI